MPFVKENITGAYSGITYAVAGEYVEYIDSSPAKDMVLIKNGNGCFSIRAEKLSEGKPENINEVQGTPAKQANKARWQNRVNKKISVQQNLF
jgi:hypothetical protein